MGHPPSTVSLSLAGQDGAAAVLESWLTAGEFPPLLAAGPMGVGKRTAALLAAQAANCEDRTVRPCGVCRSCRAIAQLNHADLKLLLPIRLPKRDPEPEEVMAAMVARYDGIRLGQAQPALDPRLRIPIGAIRWIRTEMARPPLLAQRRIFIITHAHAMNSEAANALLKMLEEPQARSTFILTSSRPSSLPATIRSRCQLVRFRPIAEDVIRAWLEENADASRTDAELASSLAEGSIGGAIRFLESREDFLVGPVVDYFAGRLGSNERAVMAALERAADAPPAAVAGTLLFLYREALRVKSGSSSTYAKQHPGVVEPNLGREVEYLRRAVKFLLSRCSEAGLNVNARLFNYTLLTTLRPPRRRLPA